MHKIKLLMIFFVLGFSPHSFSSERPIFNPFEKISVHDDYQWSLNCMALNIYHEARGEPLLGQLGVAFVVKNRVKSPKWKNDVCEVVYTPHQWSWTKDKITDYVTDLKAYKKALVIAEMVLNNEVEDPFDGADHVYAKHIKPSWAPKMKVVAVVNNLVFLKA
jgi:spore germination cell wall hydrolase CwlJ-like protein